MASENEKAKKKIRQTSKWKKFRSDIIKKRKYDELTGKRLIKGCQLHHLCMDVDSYDDTDESRYVILNRNSHKMVHFMFDYYSKDPEVLDRLKDILDRMVELNSKKKTEN